MSEITAPYPASDIRQEKSWTAAKILYTGLTGFCLLSYLWTLAIGAGINNLPTVIWIARLVSVPLAVYLGRLWKNKGFWILTLYTVLFFLRCFIPNPGSIFKDEVAESVLSALWLFTACYGLGHILNKKQLKSFLLVCAGIWTAGMTVFACMGIYSAWTEQTIHLFYDAEVYVYINSRVNIVYLATVTGSMVGITVLVASLSSACVKIRIIKCIFLIALIPLFLTVALTDSRTAYISVPAGFGVMTFALVLYYYERKEKSNTEKHKWRPWIFGILMMLVVFVSLVFILMQITPAFNQIRRGRFLIPTAYAEASGTVGIATRGFTGPNVLDGRAELWNKIIEHIKQKPMILLFGESKLAPLRAFEDYYAHCHCLYLQILLESGIPGLLLIILFILYTLIHAVRAICTPGLPLWIRLLPAIPVSLWVGDLAENFTWLRSSQCPMGAIALIAAGILCAQTPKGNHNISASELN